MLHTVMDEYHRLCKAHVSLHECVYKLKGVITGNQDVTGFGISLELQFEQYLNPMIKKNFLLTSKKMKMRDIDSQLRDASEEIFRDIEEICTDVWAVDKFICLYIDFDYL